MIRWIVTLSLAALVVVASLLGGIGDYAYARSPWLPAVTVAGLPLGGLLVVAIAAAVCTLISGVVPLLRALSLHARFNLALLAVAMGAFRLGLL